MSSHPWQPLAGRTLPEGAPPVLRRLALSAAAGERSRAKILATDDGGLAAVAPLSSLLADAELEIRWTDETAEELSGTAVWVSEATPEAEVRSLLTQLAGGAFALEPPHWALAGPRRSALAAYRAAGPTAVLRLAGDHGQSLTLALFPIRLSDRDPLRRSLTPEDKLPEGSGDNLGKREDWFQRRTGRGGGDSDSD